MNKFAQKAAAAQLVLTGFVAGAFDRLKSDERGQGSVEYVGIIVVVVAVIAIVVAAASGIGGAIVTKLTTAVNSLQTS